LDTRPTITLSDGRRIPQVGLGVWQTPDDGAVEAVGAALAAGYRHVDTAAIYRNERGVGEGLRASGVPREEVFVTTKLWNDDQGYDQALRAFDASLGRLGLDYVDLYLIHWPAPRRDRYVDSWRALIRLREEGRARSIGVSNFTADHLRRIVAETGVPPVLNQIELHPRFQQGPLRAAGARLGVATESWSPLGQGRLLSDPAILAIARWHVETGLIVIPKSVNPTRIAENFDVFGFALDDDDRAAIAGLDTADGRIGPDPTTATF